MFHRKHRLCIVSPYSYPLFNPECRSLFGGSEVRIALIAKELARRAHFDVHMLVFDHGQPRVEVRDHVKIHAWQGKPYLKGTTPEDTMLVHASEKNRDVAELEEWRRKAMSLPAPLRSRGLRLVEIRERWLTVGKLGPEKIYRDQVRIYDQIHTDIFLSHGNTRLAAELALYCEKRGKKHVFVAGSEGDYHPGYKENPNANGVFGLPGYLMLYAIERAALHVVQSERQADMLKQTYGRSAVVIPNPIDLSRNIPRAVEKGTILWVGKSDWIKRPEIVLDLAQTLPEYRFIVIMTYSNREIYERCAARAKKMSNVKILPYVPFDEVERHFASAELFVNTSVFEGFPNTFLQAGKYGVPVVSLQVDSGEMLSKYGGGLVCNGDVETLRANVQRLMRDSALWSEMSMRVTEYVRAFHDKDKIIAQYEQALLSKPIG